MPGGQEELDRLVSILGISERTQAEGHCKLREPAKVYTLWFTPVLTDFPLETRGIHNGMDRVEEVEGMPNVRQAR